MFVLDLMETLIRHACDKSLERDYRSSIASYIKTDIVPEIAEIFAQVASHPGFVRGLLQDLADDWHSSNLFDGNDIVATIRSSIDKDRKINQEAATYAIRCASPPFLSQFAEERRELLSKTVLSDRVALLKTPSSERDAQFLLRLAYILVWISRQDEGCAWLVDQSAALTSLVKSTSILAFYSLDGDPLLSRNQPLMQLRTSPTFHAVGPVLPALIVFFDNLLAYLNGIQSPHDQSPSSEAVLHGGMSPESEEVYGHSLTPAQVELWTIAIWPTAAIVLSAIVTSPTNSLILYFLQGGSRSNSSGHPLASELGINTSFRKDVAATLQQLRRRDWQLCAMQLEQERNFIERVDNILLGYDFLFNVSVCSIACIAHRFDFLFIVV